MNIISEIKPRRGRPPKVAGHAVVNYDVGALDRPPGERWVTMSNALARAGHSLTLSEKRIIATAASRLDSRRVLPFGQVPKTRISAMEYAEQFDVDLNTAYEQLQEGAKKLFDRKLIFYEAAETRRGKPLPPTKVYMHWVGSVQYQKGEGWVELGWWHELLPHLVGLHKKFTTYQLQQASALRSIYSWRLLELLTRFHIEDFCVAMDATPKQAANFAKIRTRIIEPAVKELQEKDGWIIQWHPVKAGRKVKALRFEFMRNPQNTLPF